MVIYWDFNGDLMGYPLVICYIAIENGPVEIVDLPINSMVIFHSCLLTFTRGYGPLKISFMCKANDCNALNHPTNHLGIMSNIKP